MRAALGAVLWLALLLPAAADEVELELRGFLLEMAAARTAAEGTLPAWEQRLRLDLSAWPDFVDGSAEVRADLVWDRVDRAVRADLREGFADLRSGPLDLRVGRQVVTWGVGDLLFISDVFPKDWESFFAGRPLEYLKPGADGIRLRLSGEPLSAEVVVLPFFRPDVLPSSSRFAGGMPAVPVPDPGGPEVALRLYGRAGGFDLSAHAYRGSWRTPAFRAGEAFFPPLSVYSLSAQGSALDGVVSLEAGYYDSRQGSEPGVPDSEIRFLAGYQRELAEDLTLGLQYYGEVLQGPGEPGRPAYRDLVTLRLTGLAERQALRLSLFAFYSPSQGDALVQPQVSYRFSDKVSAALGANLFGGGRTTPLGRFQADDNLYLWLRHDL